VPVAAALRIVLLGLPLEFELQGNTVFITRKRGDSQNEADTPAPEAAPLDTIRGYVRDSTGAPLQGASVTIKGTKDGSKTDMKGQFGLIHAKAGMVVVISYTGYSNKEVVITSGTRTPLSPSTCNVAKRAGCHHCPGLWHHLPAFIYVGSISTVDAETIEAQPVTNVLLAWKGRCRVWRSPQTSGCPAHRY
jgi:hypothetical protein